MQKWLENIRYKLQLFMQGRYGYDELSRFLSISGLVLLFVSCIPYLGILYLFAVALLIWSWFRAFSRNIYKRQMERQKYLTIRNRIRQKLLLIKNAWRDRKTHKYFKCPHCKTMVRIRKPEKGRTINIHCPKCRQGFIKRT